MKIENKVVYNMSAENEPIARVESGATLTFVTRDCFNNQLQGENPVIDALDWDAINPATGPVYVEGAEPGDILKVRIEKIDLAEYGTMAAIPESGVLGNLVKSSVVKRVSVKDGMMEFLPEITIPYNPMIGVIGVAPAEGAIPCGEPGNHGGNMDNTKITEGATIYFPVFHKGALLAMGDVHAGMGDGEIMVTGVEIPAEITVTVEVLKGTSIQNPRLENDEACYTIASDEDLEKAIYEAVHDMTQVLMEKRGMSLEEAGMLLSAMGNLQFCQVVDPKRTVRMEMKKTMLKEII